MALGCVLTISYAPSTATDSLRVFLPDLHLLTSKAAKRYRYGTNCIEQLVEVLKALKRLRNGLRGNQAMNVYVLGDFADLWREGTTDGRPILQEHSDIYRHLAGSPNSLQANFVLGNHDIDLALNGGFMGWDRRYYFPRSRPDPMGLVMHGDVFDMLEKWPDEIQSLVVYLLGPMHSAAGYQLGTLRKLVAKSHGGKQYRDFIQSEYHTLLPCRDMEDGLPEGNEFNVVRQDTHHPDGPHPLMRGIRQMIGQFNKCTPGFKLDIRCVVIGHTHHARIGIYDSDDEFLAICDCGAWIENCTTAPGIEPIPSAQFGVLSGNDLRIYQIVAP